ncbi:hypothetical protein FB33_0849, partial [Cutibacterium acnes]
GGGVVGAAPRVGTDRVVKMAVLWCLCTVLMVAWL